MQLSYDKFLNGRVVVAQNLNGHRSGHDAVLLAAAVCVPSKISAARFYELGAGSGAATLCVAARMSTVSITMVEIDFEQVALAQENIVTNGFSERISVFCGDVTAPFAQLEQPHHRAAHVFMNPPFYDIGTVVPLADGGKRRAHQADVDMLARWSKCAASLLRAGGRVSVIYRAEGLMRLLGALSNHFGDMRILPVYSKSAGVARRVIVSAVRDSRAPLRLLPPLVLHKSDGMPSTRAEDILRHGAPLDLWYD